LLSRETDGFLIALTDELEKPRNPDGCQLRLVDSDDDQAGGDMGGPDSPGGKAG